MRKAFIRGVVPFLVAAVISFGIVGLVMGSAKPPKYWRDILQIKPTQEWFELYGYGDESWLAHDAWVSKQLLDGQGKVIAALKKEMEALKVRVAVLEVGDPNNLIDVNISATLESSNVDANGVK